MSPAEIASPSVRRVQVAPYPQEEEQVLTPVHDFTALEEEALQDDTPAGLLHGMEKSLNYTPRESTEGKVATQSYIEVMTS